MSKRINPIETWRGSRSTAEAASRLHMPEKSYLVLENTPRKSRIKSNKIIRISLTTGIPLDTLVDYLTSTNTLTKEATHVRTRQKVSVR